MPPKRPRNKTAAAAVPVPQNRDEATAAVREIGERQRELARIQAGQSLADGLHVRQRHLRDAAVLRHHALTGVRGRRLGRGRRLPLRPRLGSGRN